MPNLNCINLRIKWIGHGGCGRPLKNRLGLVSALQFTLFNHVQVLHSTGHAGIEITMKVFILSGACCKRAIAQVP